MIYVQLIDEEVSESGLLPFRVCFRGLDPSIMEGEKDFAWDEYHKWKAFELTEREKDNLIIWSDKKNPNLIFDRAKVLTFLAQNDYTPVTDSLFYKQKKLLGR